MHKLLQILLTLPRQPEWLTVCAKSRAGKAEEKEWGERKTEVKEGKRDAVKSRAELHFWILTADMLEKMASENGTVCA